MYSKKQNYNPEIFLHPPREGEVVVSNAFHYIVKWLPTSPSKYHRYQIFEYSSTLELMDEVKHPSAKKQILDDYEL